MPKRPALPTADEFFRVTSREPEQTAEPEPEDETTAEARADLASPDDGGEAEDLPVAPPEAAEQLPLADTDLRPEPVPEKRASRHRPRPRPARADVPLFTLPGATEGPLEKVTLYLPQGLLKALEVTRVRLLTEHDVKVNRSQIAELVLARALEDMEELERLLAEHYREAAVAD